MARVAAMPVEESTGLEERADQGEVVVTVKGVVVQAVVEPRAGAAVAAGRTGMGSMAAAERMVMAL